MANIINLDSLLKTYGLTEQSLIEKIGSDQNTADQIMIEKNEEEKPAQIIQKKKEKPEVPIWHKSNLTLEEAAAYFGIGVNRLREITNERGCGFVLFVGTKRLIKRTRFEEYLSNIDTI